jgi:AraC-like DNA-binding protein
VEAIQLGPRSERTLVSCSAFRSHRILRLEAGAALAIRGAVQKGCACVVLSASAEPAARFLGKPLRVTDLLLAGAGAGMNLFVPVAGIVFILVVPSSEFMPRRTLRICDGADAHRLTEYIRQQHRSDSGVHPTTHLRDVVAASQAFPVASGRVSAVMSACRLIEKRFPAAPTLNDLTQHSGVAERTLAYGFREVYDTTPLTFARSLRLTRSRMSLLRAKSYTPINEMARACGFDHMGQYSRDYRRWFGETPSMTLARGQQSQESFQRPGIRRNGLTSAR